MSSPAERPLPSESLPPESVAWTIAETVRNRRKELEATLPALAAKCDLASFASRLGISRPFLSLIESGRRRIPPRLVVELCDELQLNEDDTKRFLAKYEAEAAASAGERFERLGASSDDVVPGVPLAALRRLLETDPTAKAVVQGMLARMPLPRRSTPKKAQRKAQRKTKR